jgi:hypothetical protein
MRHRKTASANSCASVVYVLRAPLRKTVFPAGIAYEQARAARGKAGLDPAVSPPHSSQDTRACRHLSQARAQTRWTPARKFLAVFS